MCEGGLEQWRVGDLVPVFNSRFKHHVERISMYNGWESSASMSAAEFLQTRSGEMNI